MELRCEHLFDSSGDNDGQQDDLPGYASDVKSCYDDIVGKDKMLLHVLPNLVFHWGDMMPGERNIEILSFVYKLCHMFSALRKFYEARSTDMRDERCSMFAEAAKRADRLCEEYSIFRANKLEMELNKLQIEDGCLLKVMDDNQRWFEAILKDKCHKKNVLKYYQDNQGEYLSPFFGKQLVFRSSYSFAIYTDGSKPLRYQLASIVMLLAYLELPSYSARDDKDFADLLRGSYQRFLDNEYWKNKEYMGCLDNELSIYKSKKEREGRIMKIMEDKRTEIASLLKKFDIPYCGMGNAAKLGKELYYHLQGMYVTYNEKNEIEVKNVKKMGNDDLKHFFTLQAEFDCLERLANPEKKVVRSVGRASTKLFKDERYRTNTTIVCKRLYGACFKKGHTMGLVGTRECKVAEFVACLTFVLMDIGVFYPTLYRAPLFKFISEDCGMDTVVGWRQFSNQIKKYHDFQSQIMEYCREGQLKAKLRIPTEFDFETMKDVFCYIKETIVSEPEMCKMVKTKPF